MANQSADAYRGADLDRAVAVAAEYDALQGYAWVTLGAGLLLAALTGQEGVYLALGAVFTALVPSWYHQRYGLARPTGERNLRVALGTVLALVLLVTGFVLDRFWQPPVLITLLTLAVVLGVGQHLMLRRTGLTPVHRVVHGLVALAACGPLLGLDHAALVPYVLAVAGAALVVTGLVDHRRLVRLLGPADEDADDER
ncbi:hypothetical protein GCM10009616_33040 [Microlunatus lacustris]